jgi:hypothetical protein
MKNSKTKILPQDDFKYLPLYREKFAVTDRTVFAFDGAVYANYELPSHLLVHEEVHLKQQGNAPHEWLTHYLNDDRFRLKQEIEAYKAELLSIKDRNQRLRHKIVCARNLSSELYGNIITYEEAMQKL